MISVDNVEAYRAVHYPEHVAQDYIPGILDRRPARIPGDGYVAALSHAEFHHWFGRVCDGTCPHLAYERAPNAAPLPVARVVRR